MGDSIPATAASPLTPAVDAGVRAHQQAAFRAARRKFALYGRQHAHVSHLSGQGERGDKGNDAAALTNTLLLQENGALALHADDLQYRLDGILFQQQHTGSGASDDEGEERVVVARARNVVELARMLQRPDVQRMLKLSRPSARLCITRIHDVTTLLRRRRTNACPDGGGGTEKERSADELLRLSVAVLLFSLTLAGFECDEWFPREVLDLMAECLQHEFDAQILKEKKKERSAESGHDADTRPVNDNDITQNADQSLPEENSHSHRRKTCLKRKKQSIQRRRSMSTSGDDDDAADPQGRLQCDVAALLNGHDAFGRIKQAPVTIANVLVMTLYNLLQMDTGYDQQQYNAHQRRKDMGLAGATFATLRARKRQLLENNAMHVLVDMLAHQVQQLQWPSAAAVSSSSFAESSACSLQRIETILRVLDQASFLETEVQRQLSSSPDIFAILLELIEQLSNLCWGQPRQKHANEACDKEKAMFLQGDAGLAEVLLVSMRVLINLTHHNEDAARHIYGLNGMKTLFRSFCLLWEASESTTRSSDAKATADHEDKLLFDAFLMFLSALTNCVEFSPENRDAVMTIAVSRDETMALGVGDLQIPSVCGVVTKFFLSKVQSYRHMLEWSDTNPDGGAFAPIENDENVQWVPEDVILGGCSSLLLGCLIKDSPSNAMQVLDVLPDQSPHLLLRALSAFVALHSQIGALTPEVGKSVLQVEQTFKSLLVQDSVRGSSTTLADSNVTPALNLTISAKITMENTERTRRDATSLRESTSEFSGEQVDDEGEKMLCADLKKKVRTPPASAFKLHSWKKVCSTVDSDDDSEGSEDNRQEGQEAASGIKDSPPSVQRRKKDKTLVNRQNGAGASKTTTPTASPLKKASPYRGVTKGSLKRKQASPAKLKRASSLKPHAVCGIEKEQSSSRSTQASPLKLKDTSSIKSSPAMSGSSGSQTFGPNDGSTQRLKRARHLITGLEAALSRVDGGSSTVMPSARLSACMASTESPSQNDGDGGDGGSRTPDFFHDDAADRVILLNVRNSPFRSKAKSARLSIKSSPSPARKTITSLRKVQTDQLQALASPQGRRQVTTVTSLSLSLDPAPSSKAALTAAGEAMEDTDAQTAVSFFSNTKKRKQKTVKPLKKGVAAGIFDFDA